MMIKNGTRIRIKKGWDEEGKVGKALGKPVMIRQSWVPVLWDGEEDPDFNKEASVEPYTADTLDLERKRRAALADCARGDHTVRGGKCLDCERSFS